MIQWLLIKRYTITAFVWVRENLTWILLAIIGASFGRQLLKRKDSEVNSIKDALVVERAKTDIKVLKAKKDDAEAKSKMLEGSDISLLDEQRRLEQRIVSRQRDILAVHKKSADIYGLTDAQVVQRFRDAGL